MLFWTIIGGMTAAALLLLLRPLLRGGRREATGPEGPGAASGAAPDLAIYRDQLREVERDVGLGVLSPEEAAAARLEIERRLLAADASRRRVAAASPRRGRWAAAAVAIGVPAAALGLYLQLGAPEMILPPGGSGAGERMAAGTPSAEEMDIAAMVESLAKRLADDPSDPEGWKLLARSYGTLGRYEEAAAAYEQAIARGGDGPEVQSAYGEVLAVAAGGQVTDAAAAAFKAALEADPKNPRARFYMALARAQAGKPDEALTMWIALEADAPADAPWREMVSAQIDKAARALGRDPEALPGRVRTARADTAGTEEGGPSAEQQRAVESMSPAEREAFVRGMVDSLAARLQSAPDDLDGWLRLARSYEVLGERDRALEAWRRAAELAPRRLDVLHGYATALLGQWAGAGTPLPDGFDKAVERVRGLAPEDPLGLYFAGLVAAESGDAESARALWTKVLSRLPEGSTQRAELQRRIDALESGS